MVAMGHTHTDTHTCRRPAHPLNGPSPRRDNHRPATFTESESIKQVGRPIIVTEI